MADWLTHRVQISPKKLALVFGKGRWTYGELNTLVDEMADRLAAIGVETGRHVAVLMSNRVEFVCVIHALARLGAVLVPLNTRLTRAELRWQVKHSNSQLIICDDETTSTAAQLNVPTVNVDHQKHFKVLKSETPPQKTEQVNNQFIASGGETTTTPAPTVNADPQKHFKVLKSESFAPFNLDEVQGLVYTSGTTGHPKGAMLTFNNHLQSAVASAFRLGTRPVDRWLVCMPLYHVGGMAIILRCCLYGTTVVLQNKFNPAAVSKALNDDGITLISVVPTMLRRLIDQHQTSLVTSQLRCILVGGAAIPQPLVEQCLALNLPIAATYGLTEAASQVATATPQETRQKPGSVGKPLMFSAMQIVDSEGNRVPVNEIGEVVVSGPTVMQGYYNQPEATLKTLRNSTLYTGDMGYLDEDGNLWIVQRRADLIVSGGENVYPVEVERVLRKHPAVKEVCVAGITNAEWGQQVAAAIVLNKNITVTEQELANFCRTRMAGYKQPRLFRFMQSLPQTASGKIRRGAVRQSLEAGRGN